MNKKPRTGLRRGAIWVWIAFAWALLFASACRDINRPKVIPPGNDSIPEDSSSAFLILPGLQHDVWV